ncbi:MAG: guanylate kinase [Dorea sp.]|nr:guanylate kinase [Dorea sp.]
MGKIYYLMGKSASGKDTLYQKIQKSCPWLKTITLYTTRPIREGEVPGKTYHYVDDAVLDRYERDGKVIELRAYQTVHGIWKYATIDDGQVDLTKDDYLVIGTLESYNNMKAYYGTGNLVPLYIEVEDGERLTRALQREKCQDIPKYAEMCRRFLADNEDFSEEHLQKSGITIRYSNDDIDQCLKSVTEVINYGRI